MKVSIVYYPGDPAAKGAAELLMREGYDVQELKVDAPFSDFSEVDGDAFIVLSRHSSEKKVKAFTVHHTGNFVDANLGGRPRELSYSFPSLACKLLKALEANAREGYDVTYEATHHGPTIDKPLVFIEIGSSEEEWRDPKNHEVLAKAVMEYEEQGCPEVKAIWLGGPHYSKRASKRCLEGEASIGHIAPKYASEWLDEEMVKKMVQRSAERVEVAYLEKKSFKADKRKELVKILEGMGLEVKLV